MGAAYLAGLAVGVWNDISDITKLRKSQRVFTPKMPEDEVKKYLGEWRKAVERAGKWVTE